MDKKDFTKEIEVLWIDDKCKDENGVVTYGAEMFISHAQVEGIKITPESNFEEGLRRIRQNPKEFNAVILDIRNECERNGKHFKDSDIIRDEIKLLQKKNGEPYLFLYSGDKKSLMDTHYHKEEYCSKEVYDKNGDGDILLEDIKKIAKVSSLYKTRSDYYDVLKTTKGLMGDGAYNDLLKLIYQIVTNNESRDSNQCNAIRKFLETHILSILEKNEYPYFVDPYRKEYKLSGLSHDIRGDLKIPVYIQRAFDTLEQVVQDGSHGKRSEQVRLVVDMDVKNGIAPYLLRSCLFELLNIIMWLKMWVEAEKNLQQRQQEIMGEMIIGKELPVKQEKNCWSVGKWCKLHKAFIPENDNEYKSKPKVNDGDIIRIRDVMKNEGCDKNKYPFIVTNIELYKNDTKSVLL